jgi:hypothetical protein
MPNVPRRFFAPQGAPPAAREAVPPPPAPEPRPKRKLRVGLETLNLHDFEPDLAKMVQRLTGKEPKIDEYTKQLVLPANGVNPRTHGPGG